MRTRKISKKRDQIKKQPNLISFNSYSHLTCSSDGNEDNNNYSKNLSYNYILVDQLSQSQIRNQNFIWEQDYNKLLQVFKNLGKQRQIQELEDLLSQFTLSELLFKSKAHLWSEAKQYNNQTFKKYLKKIESINVNENHIFLFKCGEMQEQFFGLINKLNQQIHIINAQPLTMQLIKNRQQFMDELNQRCKITEKCQLSQISQQILYLYHHYHKKRKQVIKKISSFQKEISNQDIEKKLKQLLRQLRNVAKCNKQKETQ